MKNYINIHINRNDKYKIIIHCNYFEMDLLSFLFRANKFDFPLLGMKPISNSPRISFQVEKIDYLFEGYSNLISTIIA